MDGQYNIMYTSDLLALDTASYPIATHAAPDSRRATINTPFNLQAWQTCLSRHPDQDFAAYSYPEQIAAWLSYWYPPLCSIATRKMKH